MNLFVKLTFENELAKIFSEMIDCKRRNDTCKNKYSRADGSSDPNGDEVEQRHMSVKFIAMRVMRVGFPSTTAIVGVIIILESGIGIRKRHGSIPCLHTALLRWWRRVVVVALPFLLCLRVRNILAT